MVSLCDVFQAWVLLIISLMLPWLSGVFKPVMACACGLAAFLLLRSSLRCAAFSYAVLLFLTLRSFNAAALLSLLLHTFSAVALCACLGAPCLMVVSLEASTVAVCAKNCPLHVTNSPSPRGV